MQQKKYLVAGAAGFLGRPLCNQLLQNGHKVVGLDNLQTGSLKHLGKLLQNPDFDFLTHDIREKISFDAKIDGIFNLACPASPPKYQADPVGTMLTSVVGTHNLLEVAEAHDARFLHASTSEVYGDPEIHPQIETYRGNVNPVGIRACYDEGKRAAEALIYDYQRTHGTSVRVVRIFNTYGPGMDPEDGRVLSNFIMQALRGNDLTVYGEGKQTRSFCYRDDLITGLISLMDAGDEVSKPINLGNPSEMTILELAELVLELVPSRSKIVFKDLPSDDPHKRCPDISLATQHLNWRPEISLREGLLPTIEAFRPYA